MVPSPKRYKSVIFIYILNLIYSFTISSEIENYPYVHPTPGEISIMACSSVSSGIQPTKQLYKDLVDCGFNLTRDNGSLDFFMQQFELIGGLNLKYIISSRLLGTSDQEWFVRTLKESKYLGGWYLIDEPHFDDLDEVKEKYINLYKEDPNHLIIVNLVGVISSKFTGKYKYLREYYHYIQELLSPGLWSYDYYPILYKNGKLIIDYEQFYSDLEDFSKISKNTNRPFWAFCETMEYKAKTYSRPAATEAYLNFEAFSALAYGAQGIAYWTYGMRNSNDEEQYVSALVDKQGKKTKAWYAAKKVNNQIKRFNDVFYQCDVMEVKHTGEKLYRGTKQLTGEFGPFKSIKSGKAGVLVSHIENKGTKYIVIVNHDILKKQKINLELLPYKKVVSISLTKPQYYSSGKIININLDKGGYVIFKEN